MTSAPIPIPYFDPRKPFLSGLNLVRDTLIKLNDLINRTGGERGEAFGPMPSYTVATLPSAANNARCWIYVSNESGGAQPAWSDGTNWRRASDRAVVS